MSGAEVDAAAFPVGAAVETAGDLRSGRADGLLYRVVAVQGAPYATFGWLRPPRVCWTA